MPALGSLSSPQPMGLNTILMDICSWILRSRAMIARLILSIVNILPTKHDGKGEIIGQKRH